MIMRTKLDVLSVKLEGLKSNFNLNVNNGSDRFIKELNHYLHMEMGILDVKEFTTGIMKFSGNMQHPSSMVIKTCSGLTLLVVVLPGHTCSMGLDFITAIKELLRVGWVMGILEMV